MEVQPLKTVLTLEFAADETQIAADVLALIASARRNAEGDRKTQRAPEPAEDKKPKANRSTKVTYDDVRNLMSDALDADEDNLPKVKKQLKIVGAKSVGAINEEDLPDFFDFLQSLKDDY